MDVIVALALPALLVFMIVWREMERHESTRRIRMAVAIALMTLPAVYTVYAAHRIDVSCKSGNRRACGSTDAIVIIVLIFDLPLFAMGCAGLPRGSRIRRGFLGSKRLNDRR